MSRDTSTSRFPSRQTLQPADPLWQLAPVRDAEGAALADFMLLIPRLRDRGPAFAEYAVQSLRRACVTFGGQVYFADMNMRTGAIWVSVEARPGLCAEVAREILRELPEAVMIGGQLAMLGSGIAPRREARRSVRHLLVSISRIPRRVARRLLLSPRGSGTR